MGTCTCTFNQGEIPNGPRWTSRWHCCMTLHGWPFISRLPCVCVQSASCLVPSAAQDTIQVPHNHSSWKNGCTCKLLYSPFLDLYFLTLHSWDFNCPVVILQTFMLVWRWSLRDGSVTGSDPRFRRMISP